MMEQCQGMFPHATEFLRNSVMVRGLRGRRWRWVSILVLQDLDFTEKVGEEIVSFWQF